MKRGHGEGSGDGRGRRNRGGGRGGGHHNARWKRRRKEPPPPWQPRTILPPAGGLAAWSDPRAGRSEVEAFYAYVSLREVELRARHAAIADVQAILREAVRGWGAVSLASFGSFAPACRPAHIFSSDLDLEVRGVPGIDPPTNAHAAGDKGLAAQAVASIGNALRRSACYTDEVKVIRFARVPLCTARHVSGVELDITAGLAGLTKATGAAKQQQGWRFADDTRGRLAESKGRAKNLKQKMRAAKQPIEGAETAPALGDGKGDGAGASAPASNGNGRTGKDRDRDIGDDIICMGSVASTNVSGASAGASADEDAGNSSSSSSEGHYHPTGVLAPMVAVMKVFLGQEMLFKGPMGGIGSYRLYVLVSAFLDQLPEPVPGDLDTLLGDLFEWAATHIAVDGTVSSMGHTTSFPKDAVHKLPRIKFAFAWAAQTLKAANGPQKGEGSDGGYLAKVIDSNQLKEEREWCITAASPRVESWKKRNA